MVYSEEHHLMMKKVKMNVNSLAEFDLIGYAHLDIQPRNLWMRIDLITNRLKLDKKMFVFQIEADEIKPSMERFMTRQ